MTVYSGPDRPAGSWSRSRTAGLPARCSGWWESHRDEVILWSLLALVVLAALGATTVTLAGSGGRGEPAGQDGPLEVVRWCVTSLAN